ncbi:MAG: hypothetical protein ACTHU0_00825 [Kofleriaceae bacterium]
MLPTMTQLLEPVNGFPQSELFSSAVLTEDLRPSVVDFGKRSRDRGSSVLTDNDNAEVT